jgi:hypothetical protein
MPEFFAPSRLFPRLASAALILALAAPASAQESNPLRAVTDAIGLTAPTGERPDFVRESRPDEDKMDFVPFLKSDKPRIPVKTPAQAAADDADLVAAGNRARGRVKKLQSESVEALAPAPKPPPVQDKF